MQDLPATITELFASRVERYPDRPFVSSFRSGKIERLTYLEAGRRVAGIADWFTEYGLRKGDRIAVYLDAGDPGIWLYLACATHGVVPVPLGPSYSFDALAQLATQCHVRAVVTAPELVVKVHALGLPILCFGEAAGAISIGERPPADPIARLRELAAGITGDDIFMFQPTSGSTGVPKVVMRRHVTFPRAGKVIAAGLEPEPGGQAGLLVQALTHGGGHYCLNVLLYLGGEVCIPSAIDTDVALTEVEQLAPTYLYLAPRILRSLFTQHDAKYRDPANVAFCGPRLQWITIGGAPPDEKLLAELERRHVEVVEGYGATEISVIAVTVRGNRRPGAAGRVLDDIIVRLDEQGEVQVKSDYGMAGYFEEAELSRSSYTEDGYFRTGDLGTIDADGFLRINGRSRDVFNSAEGSNIYPTRIEDMIEGLRSVRQAILIGDVRPFITALICVRGISSGSDAPLSPESYPALYASVRAELATINRRLEGFEQVRRFALFATPFPSAIYQTVGQAKIRRDRKQILKRYCDVVDALYDARSPYAEAV